jgi:peptidoglycan/LPS O-acetylase OafA/YrhL
MTHLKYRADIDGMRAVAVLGVIIYHAFPHALPGGFIGVDIFFVISGYLISGILYKGHREGNFSFAEFYARRIRRLFPSLIAVLAICLVYGAVVLLPNEYQQLGRHVASGTFFIQNIVFWQESGYFDTAANLKPLLHLWSLAVEEQYYIFFPPILLLLWKRKWPLVLILSILLVASMIGNLVMSYQNRASDFFLTPYRAWEFLAGSLLAWWHYDRGPRSRDGEEVPRYRHALSLGGVVILGLGMAFIHKGDPYPGWRALAPVAGTLLIIQAGRSAWVNRCLLSHPALVWIGLISYPLYLFHWPALSFVHIVKGGKSDNITIWSALAVAFALTVITYYFIERPIRYSRSPRVVAMLIAAFITTGILGSLVWEGFIRDSQSAEVKASLRWIADNDYFEGLKEDPRYKPISVHFIGSGEPHTVFLGDSNMQQYAPRLNRLIETDSRFQNTSVILVTKEGVPVIPGITRADWPVCTSLLPVFRRVLNEYPQVKSIVIASQWNRYLFQESQKKYSVDGYLVGSKQGTEAAIRNLEKMISGLIQEGYSVTLLLNPPTGHLLSPKGRIERSFHGVRRRDAHPYPTRTYFDENRAVIDSIASVARHTGAALIDPLPHLSKNDICLDEDDGEPIRFDECHLRPSYVREHVKYLDSSVAP